MTDRVNAFVVVLDKDVRIDDAEAWMNAIKMMKGVVSVTPNISSIDMHVAHMRAHTNIAGAIYDTLTHLRDNPLNK